MLPAVYGLTGMQRIPSASYPCRLLDSLAHRSHCLRNAGQSIIGIRLHVSTSARPDEQRGDHQTDAYHRPGNVVIHEARHGRVDAGALKEESGPHQPEEDGDGFSNEWCHVRPCLAGAVAKPASLFAGRRPGACWNDGRRPAPVGGVDSIRCIPSCDADRLNGRGVRIRSRA